MEIDDDDDEPHQPHLNPSTSVERMVANEKGKLEVVNDDDDGEVGEASIGGVKCEVVK